MVAIADVADTIVSRIANTTLETRGKEEFEVTAEIVTRIASSYSLVSFSLRATIESARNNTTRIRILIFVLVRIRMLVPF